MIVHILALILCYLIGSISSGLIIGKLFYHKDIRQYGSHNTGTTNAWRVLGAKAGLATFVFDFLKGYIAFNIPLWLGLDWHPLLFGLMAVIGHVYPIFTRFQGGKAVATAAGMAFAYKPLFLFINFPVIFFIVLYLTSTVSIASLTAITTAFILSFFTGDWVFIGLVFMIMIFIYYRHQSNIKRILHGEENTIDWGLKARKKNKDKE